MRVAARLLATFVLGLALAPAAYAQTPGLHVDPNSPSGHEYAIPLDRARHDAAPGAGPSSSGGQPPSRAPLFGVGVQPSRSAAPGSNAKHAARGGRHSHSTGSANGSASSPLSKASLQRATATPEAGAPASLMVIGGSALVLILGATLGLSLRRRNPSLPRS